MKKRIVDRIRRFLEALGEKIHELYFWMSGKLRRESMYCGTLAEEYSIAREHMENKALNDYLEARKKIACNGRYILRVDYGFCPENSNEIGRVTLRSRGREIDHAILVSGKENGIGTIHWIFKKKGER